MYTYIMLINIKLNITAEGEINFRKSYIITSYNLIFQFYIDQETIFHYQACRTCINVTWSIYLQSKPVLQRNAQGRSFKVNLIIFQ